MARVWFCRRLRFAGAWIGSVAAVAACLGGATPAVAGPTALPVREVTVFKDGNAFVLREGTLPVTADGSVVVDELPNPVLGTFWPYAAQSGVRLLSVTGSWHDTSREMPALTVRQMLEANVGADAVVQEITGDPYPAKILAVPQSPAVDDATSPTASGGGALGYVPLSTPSPGSIAGNLVLLQTDRGVKAVGLDRIQEVTLPNTARRTVSAPGRMSDLRLDLNGATAGQAARVGVMYLQPGIRWIPGYRVTLDGKGQAHVELEATILNELTDLDGVTVNLVIGVPTFTMADTPDPIGLQDTFARLSSYFGGGALTPGAFAKSLMTQQSNAFGNYVYNARSSVGGEFAQRDAEEGNSPGGPNVSGGDRNEDLYVYTVKNVHLKRNERMVLPVVSFTIPYRDVYTAELRPSALITGAGYEPPPAASDAVRRLAQTQVLHVVRLTDSSAGPLTTAPALIFRDGRVVAQGMMQYTAHGGTSDLTLTEASDVRVKRSDVEIKRTPNALQSEGYQYERVDLTGTIDLWNYKSEPVDVEITRYVLGKVDSAADKGDFSALDPYEDDALPGWLSQYNTANRIAFTGLGKATWTVTVPPGGVCQRLSYAWHYFVR